MPGPLSIVPATPSTTRLPARKPDQPSGKTRKDKASGKHTRRLLNRHSDPIRENGGKQFGKTK